MVIGNGMIARRFNAYEADEHTIIFASGVSQSANNDAQAFEREACLLRKTIEENQSKKLVYFSTCSIYDAAMAGAPYVQHKLAMEQLIQDNCLRYCIFRVSNPVGYTDNKHTVLNYFVHHITAQLPFVVWKNAVRNLIDLDDMYLLCHHFLLEGGFDKQILNIANPDNNVVLDIVRTIEKHFRKKANYTIIDKENNLVIDIVAIQPLFSEYNMQFGPQYLSLLLQKYFPVN